MSAAYMRRCARKKRYGTKEEADKARTALSKLETQHKSAVYRCDQCLGWHIGRTAGFYITRNRTGKRPNKRMRGRI